MIPSACYSFHLISCTRFSRGQSHHKSGSLNNKYEYHSTTQSTAKNHLPMYEPLPSSRQSHSQNDPENPSRATAVVVGHVHRGLRRDQLLDHGGMAFLSRAVQPRQASVPGMRGGRRGSCSCRRQTRHSYGMFLRVVGQSFFDRS